MLNLLFLGSSGYYFVKSSNNCYCVFNSFLLNYMLNSTYYGLSAESVINSDAYLDWCPDIRERIACLSKSVLDTLREILVSNVSNPIGKDETSYFTDIMISSQEYSHPI